MIMELKEKYNLKDLTPPQERKANKIVKLMEELKNEGVNTVVIASPTNSISFYRADRWADDIDDMDKICNNTYFMHNPKQENGLIDHFGF